MRGVVVLLGTIEGFDRQVGRLLDLPALSGVRSGSWQKADLDAALREARARLSKDHRLTSATAIDLTLARLARCSGPIQVRRAHATEGIRRIRQR